MQGGDIMDMSMVNSISNYQAAQTMNAVSVAVLGKAMDVQETQGAGVVKMIESVQGPTENSVRSHLGGNFDMFI